ncbi:MAG: hypothetical protein ACHQF0_08255 [Chitinophagales bacterium]
MEVHHHPHVEKKKFREYFLEFIMIFLAVTLGFFAENIREHYTEKAHAKEYLEAYRDELLQQQVVFDQYIRGYQQKVFVCDSMKTIFYNKQENERLADIARLLVPSLKLSDVPVSTASYDQMVSAGALRNINNILLRDSMAAYKGQIEELKNYNSHLIQHLMQNTELVGELSDFHDVISTDTAESFDAVKHIPDMQRFDPLTNEQRRRIVFFYEQHIFKAQSDLLLLRLLKRSNKYLLEMVNAQLKK